MKQRNNTITKGCVTGDTIVARVALATLTKNGHTYDMTVGRLLCSGPESLYRRHLDRA